MIAYYHAGARTKVCFFFTLEAIVSLAILRLVAFFGRIKPVLLALGNP